MKTTCVAIAAVFLIVSASLSSMSGEQVDPVKPKPPIRFSYCGPIGEETATPWDTELYVLGGDLMFVARFVNGERPGGPGDPPLPDHSLAFRVHDGMIRAKIEPLGDPNDQDKSGSAELLAKDGWYVTADFSTDPPRVVLTEEPTDHSRWTFVSIYDSIGDGRLDGANFIKNEGAHGQAVWLSMEEGGETYRGFVARRPLLSTKKKDYYWIGPYNEGK